MNNQQESVEQDIDLQSLAEQGQEPVVEQEEAPQLSAVEQKAFDQGWRPEDEFNGPSENWKTPKEYIQAGEFMDQINQLKGQVSKQQQDFDTRIENVNKYNKAQTDAKIKSLKAEQRGAVDVSDTELFDSAQSQIDELEKQTVTEAPAPTTDKDPTIAAWETKNPWINDTSDERGSVAVGVWNAYVQQNPNASTAQALAHVDARIERLYPVENKNLRRDQPNTTENNARRPARSNKGLTMADLTGDEKQAYQMFGNMYKDEAQFLKTVADARKIK